MIKKHYEVLVGNIGTVWSGSNGAEAMREYGQWKRLSKGTQGRASGEDVTLFKDGEILFEHHGRLNKVRED